MPHDAKDHWHEPDSKFRRAGSGTFVRPPRPYDVFMEEQGIPIFRDIGISKVQNLPLKPWARMGGRGTFIQLFGTEGLWGCYLVEVPGAGALNVEKHMYEENILVIEGRGSTEVWHEGEAPVTFEWQAGSMFAIPMNACHRIVNASSSPALLLVGTTAPNVMNLFNNPEFIFDNPFRFQDRFDARRTYFDEVEDVTPDPIMGRAMRKTNFIPDIINCDLPLDNRRSPGYRRIEPYFAQSTFYSFIGQHETGRYSKAHAHTSSAVLICLKGKGYTYTWPSHLGTQPFATGKGDQVRRVDYEPVGLVSAAPMSGDWFHQHFGVSKEPLRLAAWFGPTVTFGGVIHTTTPPGTVERDTDAASLEDGGTAIPYNQEDPFFRREFEAALALEGVQTRMEQSLYEQSEARTEFMNG